MRAFPTKTGLTRLFAIEPPPDRVGTSEVAFVPGAPAYCRLTLVRRPGETVFTVCYYDEEGLSDFLVLQTRFQYAHSGLHKPVSTA